MLSRVSLFGTTPHRSPQLFAKSIPHMCVSAQIGDDDSSRFQPPSVKKGRCEVVGPNQVWGVTSMSLITHWADKPNDLAGSVTSNGANHVVLMVEDYQDARPELKQVLKQNGYRVIDTDNGQDAARHARQTHPDLLVVDMDVPLLYGLVAARQIIKHAQVGPMPVVIVTHDDIVDPAPMMEVGATRNEYVTRVSDYDELKHLLDYLLPATADTDPGIESLLTRRETIR
jgi:CheY-like chemotaxis protein